MDKSINCDEQPWHMFCFVFNRALLHARHHSRSRPNLNQRNPSLFSGTAHERFDQATMHLTADQSHRDRLHTTTPDRNRCGPSSYDDAPSDRMRRRGRRRDRQRTISGTGRCHRVSRMEPGSRPLSLCLFRPLRPTITRSTG